MSFLGGGGTNTFHPVSAYAPGTKATVQNLQPAINTANTNYGSANTGFNTLASALQQQMTGGGPNLANAQLQSATAQNVGNQAALMAGQRGGSANAGLIARQAAQQGAGIQQQAAGQAAQNVLAQQLAAQGQLGNVLSSQAGAANQNLGIQQNAMSDQNKAILSDTQERNKIENENAAANAKNQGAGMSGLLSGIAQAGLGVMTGGLSGLATGALTSMVPKAAGAEGGMPSQMPQIPTQQLMPQQPAPQQVIPQFLQNFASGMTPQQSTTQMTNNMAEGGLPFTPHDYRAGGQVEAKAPQQKATKPGNNYSNDKIPAMLSEKEIVLPRNITQSPNAPQAAAEFVAQVMAGKHRK